MKDLHRSIISYAFSALCIFLVAKLGLAKEDEVSSPPHTFLSLPQFRQILSFQYDIENYNSSGSIQPEHINTLNEQNPYTLVSTFNWDHLLLDAWRNPVTAESAKKNIRGTNNDKDPLLYPYIVCHLDMESNLSGRQRYELIYQLIIC